jgi:hypothetical protein
VSVLGSWDLCWCGAALGHAWPGAGAGAPHPREAGENGRVKVFVSAAREARPLALPALIGGFETDVEDGATEVRLAAVGGEVAWLVATPTGREWRPGLPWWEAVPERAART